MTVTIAAHKWLILILLVAVVIRVAYLLIIQPPVAWYDSGLYDGLAWHLINGQGYSTADMQFSVQREPGYSVFLLAPVYLLFGHSILAVQIVQITLNLLVVVLMYRLAYQLFSPAAGLISAIFLAFHPLSIIYSGEIMTEIFYTLLLLIAVILFFLASQKAQPRYFFLAGIAFGLASLTRFNTSLIFIFLYLALRAMKIARKTAAWYSLLVAFGIMLTVTPWIVRNYIHHKKFIPGRISGGQAIWSGSYIPWDGDWVNSPPSYTLPQFKERLKGVDWVDQDKIFLQEAWKNIKGDPWQVAWIWFKKPFKIILIDEVATYLHLEKLIKYPQLVFFEKWPALILVLRYSFQLIHWLFLFPGLCMLCMYVRRRHPFALISGFVVLYVVSTYIPMHGVPRYFIPLSPYILLFTAVALVHLVTSRRGNDAVNFVPERLL